jgi:hypothetical protein
MVRVPGLWYVSGWTGALALKLSSVCVPGLASLILLNPTVEGH